MSDTDYENVTIELTRQQAEKLLDIIAEWESEYSWGRDEDASRIKQIVKGVVAKVEG